MNVLVTGGAGFIGSHLVRSLLADGEQVTVLDNLDPQVHGKSPSPPKGPRLRTVVGDVRDRALLLREIRSADAVVHLAAAVGVGQSQYRIDHYVDVNIRGTGILLDLLANERNPVKRLVVAGSMSSYGEGAFECRRCGRVRPGLRAVSAMKRNRWEPSCPVCDGPIRSVPTREDDRFLCSSIYAVTKMTQEELVLNYGTAYGIPAVALRFFNVYGPGQSLSNPYTGVAAIFMSRLKNGHPPVVYEDGLQSRDFVSVHDIVQAITLSLRRKIGERRVFNVGTGVPTTVLELAEQLAESLEADVRPVLARKFRSGDIRHCYSDISAIREALGYRPKVKLRDGLQELVEWADAASARDGFEEAHHELVRRGLV